MLSILVCACLPFSFPSFYLVYKITKKNFLSSVFNQHIALMLVFSGQKILTFRTWKLTTKSSLRSHRSFPLGSCDLQNSQWEWNGDQNRAVWGWPDLLLPPLLELHLDLLLVLHVSHGCCIQVQRCPPCQWNNCKPFRFYSLLF